MIFPFSPESLSVAVTVTTALPGGVYSGRVTWVAKILISTLKHWGKRNIYANNTAHKYCNKLTKGKIAFYIVVPVFPEFALMLRSFPETQ